MTRQSFKIGGLEVVRVVELEFPLGPAILPVGRKPGALARACDWAKPHFLTEAGEIVFAVSAIGVVSHGKRIVIDPCCSFDLRRDNPDIADHAAALLDNALPAAGFAPEEVDLVVNSHLDGVGWNVRPGPDGWKPAFPRARHIWPRLDIEAALDEKDSAAEALRPLLEADVIDRIDAPFSVTPEITMHPSPGHTSGNTDIWIESNGECAVLVGDHILNPIQCADPEWTALDQHPNASPQIRRALLQECAARNALMIGPHFGGPGAGRVRPLGDNWLLEAEGS